jgi:pimeloyl-ACP methyl ester carboxylesterase
MSRRWMTSVLNIVIILMVAYMGFLALLWRFQERIVFQPPTKPEAEDSTSTLVYNSADGVRLVAYVVEPDKPTGPIVLAFHGNAEISRWSIPWARELSRRLGATVVVPEFRGYDGLAGTPTYGGVALDAAAALSATVERFHRPSSDLVYYGHSLGTAIATELASTHPPRALLLESPFTSAREMARRMRLFGLGWFWSAISRVHYETAERVTKLDVPVSVAHGDEDVIIPVTMGRAVYDAARRKGGWLLVRDAGHNDVAIVGGDSYWRWIQAAIPPGAH